MTPETVADLYVGITPELVPDFYGLKGDLTTFRVCSWNYQESLR